MKRSSGTMSGRSRRFRRRRRLTVNDFLKEFELGEKVALDLQPWFSSMPHPRFNGKTGEVIGKRGRCYIVRIRDGSSLKTLIVSPVHLRKVNA